MSDQRIEVVPYRSEWVDLFEQERSSLALALALYPHQIEHIGSTSVPGLHAKPIIDIAVLLDDLSCVDQLIEPLAALGYEYQGEYGLPGRRFFTRGKPRVFHLHLVDGRTDHWQRWLTFREILRRNEEIRGDYERLKQELAQRFSSDRAGYTASKSDFINDIVERELGLP